MHSFRYFKRFPFDLFALLLILACINQPVFAQDSTATDSSATASAAGGGGGDVPTDQESISNGQQIFTNNCTQCHAVTNEVVLGPGLQGILERRTVEWLIPWIQNSQKVIQSGDEYAVQLYNKYNQTQMQAFPNLTGDDIKDVLAYVESASGSGGAQAGAAGGGATAPADGGGDQATGAASNGGGGGGISSQYFTIILGALLVILLLVLLVLVMIVSLLSKFLNSRQDLPEEDREALGQKTNVGNVLKSKAVRGGVAILFILVVGKVALDKVMFIGITQGYAPTQPIAFSHKLHSGQYKINCAYCHTTVYKSMSANIPSANICMNCHNAIKQASPEIRKIYAAIEKDQPIEWVRVHNLPDLAYFNHSQHTNVGGLQCANCHGEIEKMEVVQQASTLTMGWCINCHRETVVNSKGNEYYDKLLALHNGKEMKVADVGGLECSKCHY